MKKMKKRATKKMRGGSYAFVGKPWGPQVASWPGVSSTHDGDHLAYNSYKTFDPYSGDVSSERAGPVYPHKMNGGFTYYEKKDNISKKSSSSKKRMSKYRKNSKKNLSGGGYFPLLGDATIMGSRVSTGLTNTFYNKLFGHPQTVSPLPWENQFGYK